MLPDTVLAAAAGRRAAESRRGGRGADEGPGRPAAGSGRERPALRRRTARLAEAPSARSRLIIKLEVFTFCWILEIECNGNRIYKELL